MNVLILKDKDQFDVMIHDQKVQHADFVAYGHGSNFVIVKDRAGNRVGLYATAAMMSNILSKM